MLTHRFTVVPVLLALAIGIASSPTSIFQICQRNIGTLEIEPWRTKSGAVARAVKSLLGRLAGHVRAFGETQAAVAVGALAILALTGQLDSHAGMVAGAAVVGNLKLFRQKAGDLNAQLVAKRKERAAIGDACVSENRAMTKEEREKFTALGGEVEAIQARIDENSEFLAEAEAANEAERRLVLPGPDADAQAHARATASAGVTAGQVMADMDPKRGFKSHTEFMTKVMEANRFGRIDGRLKPLAAAGSDEHGTHDDPSAAYLIPVAFSPDILSVQAEGDPTAMLTRKMPMTSPSVKVRARNDKDHSSSVSGGLVVYRHSETNAINPTKMATEQLTFNAEDLTGAAYATENQIADSPVSFISLLSDGFRDEFARKMLREKLRGTGSGGQFLGVLNSPALITVAKENGQKADSVLKENIDKMEARLWGPDASDRVVWVANKTTLPQLSSLVQIVGTGGNAVPYLTTAPDGSRRLNGRRIFFTEVCSALGDVGDIILGNWAEYIEATMQGLQQSESIHVRFLNNERCFKFWLRNAGMPWWSVPMTPENGDTLSPFVTLAAR